MYHHPETLCIATSDPRGPAPTSTRTVRLRAEAGKARKRLWAVDESGALAQLRSSGYAVFESPATSSEGRQQA